MNKGFEIVCKECGSNEDIRLLPNIGEWESTVRIVCNKCDNDEIHYCN